MEELFLEKTFSTPLVQFNSADHSILFEGRVIPEDANTIFTPVTAWVEKYFEQGNNKLKLIFRLYYYNTSSSKKIVLLLKRMDDFASQGKEVSAIWEYEEGDDDCMRDGEDYKAMVKFPLDVVETKEL
ncbi:MAG: DUF1987 domain-containing protein [Bacteroidota bacterium]|jgi:hypothetical protein